MFVILWITLVYAPIGHMVWGGGYLSKMGVLDFAGGTVVHINSGIAGLVAAIVIGKRKSKVRPHNVALTMIGASMLWVGWFGFNAGSAVAANGSAGMAMLVTQIAAATAGVAWMLVEWFYRRKETKFTWNVFRCCSRISCDYSSFRICWSKWSFFHRTCCRNILLLNLH